jgi:hypothetical protein
VYFNVKDGWEPLCKALDKPIPKVPFPRLNDNKSFEEVMRYWAIQGLIRWAVVGAALLLSIAVSVWIMRA